MNVVCNALNRKDWLVSNYGPRCTLVSAASCLLLLGAASQPLTLVSDIERRVHFKERRFGLDLLAGPRLRDYLALPFRRAPLDIAIEEAAASAGLQVESRTRLLWQWQTLTRHLDSGYPLILNCLKAPSGSKSHSLVCIGHDQEPDKLVTADPNDGKIRFKNRGDRKTGIIVSITLIKPRCANEPSCSLQPCRCD